MHHGTRQAQPLFHAARQRHHRLITLVRQIDEFQQFADQLLAPLRRYAVGTPEKSRYSHDFILS